MNSSQYEELCRYFLSVKLGINTKEIHSVRIPNPKRPGLPEYKHQIDLYWETGNELSLFLNIANAKWRSSEKVKQSDVLLLQQVKVKVAAHKALMLSNVGFTSGAIAVAKDEGISLHIIRPDFDYSILPKQKPIAIQEWIQKIATSSPTSIYQHVIVHKAYDFSELSKPKTPQARGTALGTGSSSKYSTKVHTSGSTKAIGSAFHKDISSRSGSNNKSGCATKDGRQITRK